MIRSTTPMHIFNIPFNASNIKRLRITYVQKKLTVVEKTEKDAKFDGNTITVVLTQQDTLKFDERRPVEVQIKVMLKNGQVAATSVGELEVGRALNEEVLF